MPSIFLSFSYLISVILKKPFPIWFMYNSKIKKSGNKDFVKFQQL